MGAEGHVAFMTLQCTGTPWTANVVIEPHCYIIAILATVQPVQSSQVLGVTLDAITKKTPLIVSIFRIIFLGLITCLSGSSYFFIIAVIILLRRQFRKPERETETQHKKPSKEIELQGPSNPTEKKPCAPKTQKLTPHAPKVCARIVLELEEGGEVQGTEQPPQGGRLISTNSTQERLQLQTLTETTVEFAPLPSAEAKMEMDGQEEEMKEEKEEFSKAMNAQVEKEKLDHQTDDENELEKETTQSNETGGPQN